MTRHERIVNKLKEDFIYDSNVESMFVIGSVARGTQNEYSDLDIVLIYKESNTHKYTDQVIDTITVEIQGDSLKNYLEWIEERPFRIYTFEAVKVIFDKCGNLEILLNKIKSIKEHYVPKNNSHLKHWLKSVLLKLESAKQKEDLLLTGYLLSNVLGIIIQSLYNVNKLPTPPSTQAYEKITQLALLPTNFHDIWKETLTGSLEQRKKATIKLINFCIEKLMS